MYKPSVPLGILKTNIPVCGFRKDLRYKQYLAQKDPSFANFSSEEERVDDFLNNITQFSYLFSDEETKMIGDNLRKLYKSEVIVTMLKRYAELSSFSSSGLLQTYELYLRKYIIEDTSWMDGDADV